MEFTGRGLDGLCLAVLAGNIRQVDKLASRGNINHQTWDGSTPLMLAALMGNPIAVCNLLVRQADWRLEDNQGWTARQYANDNARTSDLVKCFRDAGVKLKVYHSRAARQQIATVLRDAEALRAVYRSGDHFFSRSSFYKDTRHSFTVFAADGPKSIHVGGDIGPSTCGFISAHGSSVIFAAAISGWGPTAGQRSSMHLLDNVKYTELVREACRIMQFHLPASQNDNGNQVTPPELKGRYHACHIEKKLGVYWLQYALNSALGTTDLNRLAELKNIRLPSRVRQAKIFLTRRPCYTCFRFLAKIRRLTGLDICAESRPQLTRHTRPNPPPAASHKKGCRNCPCTSCRHLFGKPATAAARPPAEDTRQREADEFALLGNDFDAGFDQPAAASSPPHEENAEAPRLRESLEPATPGAEIEDEVQNQGVATEPCVLVSPEVDPDTPTPLPRNGPAPRVGRPRHPGWGPRGPLPALPTSPGTDWVEVRVNGEVVGGKPRTVPITEEERVHLSSPGLRQTVLVPRIQVPEVPRDAAEAAVSRGRPQRDEAVPSIESDDEADGDAAQAEASPKSLSQGPEVSHQSIVKPNNARRIIIAINGQVPKDSSPLSPYPSTRAPTPLEPTSNLDGHSGYFPTPVPVFAPVARAHDLSAFRFAGPAVAVNLTKVGATVGAGPKTGVRRVSAPKANAKAPDAKQPADAPRRRAVKVSQGWAKTKRPVARSAAARREAREEKMRKRSLFLRAFGKGFIDE